MIIKDFSKHSMLEENYKWLTFLRPYSNKLTARNCTLFKNVIFEDSLAVERRVLFWATNNHSTIVVSTAATSRNTEIRIQNISNLTEFLEIFLCSRRKIFCRKISCKLHFFVGDYFSLIILVGILKYTMHS